LTILTLGFDAFVQQLLTTQDRIVLVPVAGTSISSTTSLDSQILSAMIVYPETLAQLTLVMLANVKVQDQPIVIVAATSPERSANVKRSDGATQALVSPLKADCPSGNCVWKPYYALDICTQCRSTTDEMTLKNLSPGSSNLPEMVSAAHAGRSSTVKAQTSNFTLEVVPKSGRTWQVTSSLNIDTGGYYDGNFIQKIVWPLNFAGSDGSSLDTTGWTNQSFAGLDGPVAAIGFAEFGLGNDGVPSLNNSLECAMTYCVKEYKRSVVRGKLVSDVLSTHYGGIARDVEHPSVLSWTANVNGTPFSAGTSISFYGTGIATLAGYMVGNATNWYSGSCSATQDWSCTAPSMGGNANLIYSALSTDAWEGIGLTPNFTTVLENANTLLSEIFQQYGNISQAGDDAVTKSFVVVRWAWIALPAAVVIFGLMILGLTVWETTRLKAPIWKSSLLPLLYRFTDVVGGAGPVAEDPNSPRMTAVPSGHSAATNLVSNFEVEAEATSSRLAGDTTGPRLWRLQSLEVTHQSLEKSRLSRWILHDNTIAKRIEQSRNRKKVSITLRQGQ
jgi:hypothetical protein